jgi:hypothetical protein
MNKMKHKKLTTRVAIGLTALALMSPMAHASNGKTCHDGKGNPHYCYAPDVDEGNDPAPGPDKDRYMQSVYAVVAAEVDVPHGKTGQVQAQCPAGWVATGSSYSTKQDKALIPQRQYVESVEPTDSNADGVPDGMHGTLMNGSAFTSHFTVFVYCAGAEIVNY